MYNQGLGRYPRNLDLAYNKSVAPFQLLMVADLNTRARVELEVATHPLLVRHMDAPLIAVLEEALTSHRYALDLDPNNADTLFNTAQVLVAIAEGLAKDDSRIPDALQFLEEALEMQNRSLSVQELKHEESEQQRLAMETQAATTTSSEQPTTNSSTSQMSTPSSTTAAAEDQWFSILEPITPDTLIDTILAQLSTLTTICSIVASTFPPPPTPALSWLGSYPTPLLTTKLPLLTTSSSPERLQEIALTKATFLSRLLEAGLRHSTVDATTYISELSTAFSVPELSIPYPTYPTLLAHSEALSLLASALSETDPSTPGFPFAAQRWTALSQTTTLLTQASKLLGMTSQETAKTHFERANASLALAMLSQPPAAYAQAVKNGPQLLRNGEVWYRNAWRLLPDSQREEDGEEEEEEEEDDGNGEVDMKAVAGLRCTVAQVLQGKTPEAPLGADMGRSERWVRAQVAEMREEGLVPEGFMGGL
jgi:tetratricopeptide (TPR) repeat protein